MPDADFKNRLSKLRKKAHLLKSQQHVEKIVGSFQSEHRATVISELRGMLPEVLEAKEPEPVELRIKHPDSPRIQESTALRLNMQAAKILEQEKVLRENAERIRSLELELKATKELLDEKGKQ